MAVVARFFSTTFGSREKVLLILHVSAAEPRPASDTFVPHDVATVLFSRPRGSKASLDHSPPLNCPCFHVFLYQPNSSPLIWSLAPLRRFSLKIKNTTSTSSCAQHRS